MHYNRKTQNLIAQFRGLPANRSRAIDRGVKGMGTLMAVLTEEYKLHTIRPEEIVVRHWNDIMGENAHRAQPVKIVKGYQLIISIPNPTVKREVLFQRRSILKRLRDLPGLSRIRDIRIQA